MVDNIDITPGTGKSVRTDDVSGVHMQIVKLDAGGDGVSVPVVAGQQAMAASVPVVVASDQSAVPVSGTVAVTNAGITTIAGAVAGTEMQVDVLSSALPSGAATSALQGGGLPAALGAGGGLKVDGSGTALPVSGTVTATIGASENVIGLVGASDIVVTVTPTCDTNIYGSGDLLFDSTEIAGAVRVAAGICILQSLTLLDKDDQGVSMTLVFANAATDFGTLNAVPDPDDTECATILGTVEIAAGDYVDMGAARVATLTNLGLMMKAAATSLYVAAIVGTGTPTYSASGLVLQLAFIRS
ncbi:MAG: hypothetical protein WC565_04625 [Parcubacteria group bacterium]